MKTAKSNIEVKSFFDGTQSVTNAFAFLIAQKTRKNVTDDIQTDIAGLNDLRYNTDNKVISHLPSGCVGD